jgi:hypothetical protein
MWRSPSPSLKTKNDFLPPSTKKHGFGPEEISSTEKKIAYKLHFSISWQTIGGYETGIPERQKMKTKGIFPKNKKKILDFTHTSTLGHGK